MTAGAWRHEWLDHFAMEYYGDSDTYDIEEKAVATAKEKLAKKEEGKSQHGNG